MGDAIGVQKKEGEEGKEDEPFMPGALCLTASIHAQVNETDFKARSKFSSHMGKSEAASEFSMSKTIAEQRRSLPAFKVRDRLLQIVRENAIIVLVGETGSGKTTQIAQYLVRCLK